MSRQELPASVSAKAEASLESSFDAIYNDLITATGDMNLVQIGIRHGVKIGAAAVIDALVEGGVLQISAE